MSKCSNSEKYFRVLAMFIMAKYVGRATRGGRQSVHNTTRELCVGRSLADFYCHESPRTHEIVKSKVKQSTGITRPIV